MKRLPVRASATLRATIDQAGPVSAATRALLWLGADASGLPIAPAGQREIAGLLVEELEPCVLVALQQLYDRLRDGGAGDAARAASVAPHSRVVEAVRTPGSTAGDGDDPFANVGIEFAG